MAAPVRARTAGGRLGDGLQPSMATKATVTPPHPGPRRHALNSAKGYTPAPCSLPGWLAPGGILGSKPPAGFGRQIEPFSVGAALGAQLWWSAAGRGESPLLAIATAPSRLSPRAPSGWYNQGFAALSAL